MSFIICIVFNSSLGTSYVNSPSFERGRGDRKIKFKFKFQEAFNMIDQNRDGFIEKEDLHDMLASLGKNPTDDYLEAMMNEAPGPINFTMFLTLFGERLQGTDPEDVIKNAFGCFDEENNGFISEDRLRELLTTMGDRFTDEDVSWL